MESVIEIKNFSLSFKHYNGLVPAVLDINLTLKKGQTLGLVGESGSGKSVTSLAIMGLLPFPEAKIISGEVLYQGKDLLKINQKEFSRIRGSKITMVFQEPMTSLNPVFSIGNQLMEPLQLHQGLKKKEAFEKAVSLLEEVGLPDPERKVHDFPHQLSGGQRQRVMIAMALACEPDFMICDEPTTALDVTIQKQVLELLIKLQKTHQMGLLFISHDLSVVGELCHEVAVMKKGKIVEKGSARELFLNPKDPYTKGLLACRPKLDQNPKRLLTVEDFSQMEDDPNFELPRLKKEIKTEKSFTRGSKEEPLLKVSHCSVSFPLEERFFGPPKKWFKAVEDISFTLHKGMTLGFVGESGSGKTTLGRAILQLVKQTEGKIYYQGQCLNDLSKKEMRDLRKKVQIIFQDPYSSLNPRKTVGELITTPMTIHNIGNSKKERMEMAKELLQKVGLDPVHINRYPHQFSGGQRQRISIARTLSLKPEFIICDESVSALDVSIQAQVLNLLQDLQEEFDLTYIFISHDLNVVKYFSDEIIVMKEGKIVERATPSELYRNPKSDYTKKLINSIPKGIEKENRQKASFKMGQPSAILSP
ncbi:MAG: ABC transporter ATP-binding protein [Bdellovibrionota bacterium]|nr:ABC transporter ATP-binding protein [Bdellovibrionota bacterium]